MPVQRNTARKPVVPSRTADYGLLDEMEMIVPPPVQGDEATPSAPETPIHETTTAPSDSQTGPSAIETENSQLETSNAPSAAISETANAPHQDENRLTRDNYTKFQLPHNVGILSKDLLDNSIITRNELFFINLKALCESYFKHNKLMNLCNSLI